MSAGTALASGGLSCEVDDETMKLDVQSGITRGMGSPVFNFRGEAEIRAKDVPAHLAKMTFEQSNLPQYWLDQTTLNLLLYRETEGDLPHGYVEITIQAQPRDSEEGTYGGQYDLTVFDVGTDSAAEPKDIRLSGPISCFVE